MSDLLQVWKNFKPETPPFILDGDKSFLNESILSKYTVTHNWCSYNADRHFGDESECRFHLGLRPIPFAGNLKNSKLFILMLNPGFNPSDYYAEYQSDEFVQALQKTYQQDDDVKNIFLEPRFSWHPGFSYWHKKFSSLINAYTANKNITRIKTLQIFQDKISFLEVYPYHSQNFKQSSFLKNLYSKKIIVDFVEKVLVDEAKKGEAMLLVLRGNEHWKLEAQSNIFVYKKSECRAGHINEKTRDGKILNFLLSTT
jgi:hypothetical protein